MAPRLHLSYVAVCLSSIMSLIGCGAAPDTADANGDSLDTERIDVSPQSLTQAAHSISQIDAILSKNPRDERALAAREALKPALENLNHLLATVQLSADRAVQFYEPVPGAILISERYPEGQTASLKSEDYQQLPADLYRQLTKTSDVPPLLATAQLRAFAGKPFQLGVSAVSQLSASSNLAGPAAVAGPAAGAGVANENVASRSSALTANDGRFFHDNECFKLGSVPGGHLNTLCLPNWFNGGFFDVMAGATGLKVAPFSGNSVRVDMFYNNGFGFTDTVFRGEVRSFQWFSSTACTNQLLWWYPVCRLESKHHRWEINDASGDGFHWSAFAD